VSIGELFDKISILKLKLKYVKNKNLHQHIYKELDILISLYGKINNHPIEEILEYQDLLKINEKLWIICDQRRELDAKSDFSKNYVDLSRQEYLTNDKRAHLKKCINNRFKSEIIEVKSYDWFHEE
jgi:hypothetical protein